MAATRVNAVFEGGGVKGISLTGAVKAAEQAGICFHRVAGTSSGSIVASLLATGHSASEMKSIIESTPFRSFLKQSPIFRLKVIGPAIRLFLRNGLYSGDALELWIGKLLAAKGVVRFGDLPKGALRIVASDITNGKLLVLPDDIALYGIDPERFSVARAIRMSASIPFFFDPVILRTPIAAAKAHEKIKPKLNLTYVVDGGLLSNFPLWVFDDDDDTDLAERRIPVIGFQMVGKNDSHPNAIRGPVTMLKAMFETMLSAHDERYIEDHNRARAIKIPTLGVSTTDFGLSKEKSEQLYLSGLAAGEKFFKQWNRDTGKIE
ncbi:patatin-like phospholipase family protein [Cohnella faecalis]|uniref:Patatin n=1 Tax=Cohnella faecalis TaxID=2315694 RepID=A0A398CIQ8_9BACL|nr:patatin-like phospholipase family protein [Cohnella faecalis]RIE00748.1 patatin [Cohnella faecalis]